jgi:hypothetical protein
MTCPSCQAVVDGDSRFCKSCGRRLESVTPAAGDEWLTLPPVPVPGPSSTPYDGATTDIVGTASTTGDDELEPPAPVAWLVIGALGALLLIAGSWMTWTSVEVLSTTVPVSGIDNGDGWITAAFGVIAAGVCVGAWQRRIPLWVLTLSGGGAVALMLYELVHIPDDISNLAPAARAASVTLGAGVWLCLAGAVAVLVTGVVGCFPRRSAT